MEVKKTYKSFRYQNTLAWKSGRRGVVSSEGKPNLDVSSPPEFKGEAGIWTPEGLFVASVNVCTLMTFVAFALHKGLEFTAYECGAEGLLENVEGKYRFTEIALHPRVTVKSPEDIERARELLDSAHRNCLVSNSITATVKVVPDIQVASGM